MIMVTDEDFEACAQKLITQKFTGIKPNRAPPPDILATLKDPDGVVADTYAAWAPLDNAARIFDYPEHKSQQVFLLPNSFACLPLKSMDDRDYESSQKVEFNSYSNVHHPSERASVESSVNCALLLESPEHTEWTSSLMVSIWTISRYLDIRNDIFDPVRIAKQWGSSRNTLDENTTRNMARTIFELGSASARTEKRLSIAEADLFHNDMTLDTRSCFAKALTTRPCTFLAHG
jgi:hypothetical protein